MNTLNERMNTKQAEYKTDIGNLAADFGKFAAKTEAEIGKHAAKTEAEISKLGEKMARRETWLLAAVLGGAVFVTAVLGVVISLFSLS